MECLCKSATTILRSWKALQKPVVISFKKNVIPLCGPVNLGFV